MKNRVTLCMLILLIVSFSSCTKDNYDAPESNLKGRVTYNGKPLDVCGSDQKVRLQLYQDGYEKRDAIEVFVGQEGQFSAKLFDGQYKLVTRNSNGPWVNTRDTTVVNVKGNTMMDLEVTPFYLISNAVISLSGNELTTSFEINKIVPTAKIERIIVLLNKTQFVDDGSNIFRKNFDNTPDAEGAVSYTIDLKDQSVVANSKALFARVCVWTRGADQGIYCPVIRLR